MQSPSSANRKRLETLLLAELTCLKPFSHFVTKGGTESDSGTMDFTFLTWVSWESALIGTALILSVMGGWTWLVYKSDPERGTMDSPDATAFLRGKCGDAMKISLRFAGDRVVEAKYWTDGCRMSSACGAAAARLALHKTPEEIGDIDYVAIERAVDGLPEEEMHCATLAAGTLQEAVRLYLVLDDHMPSQSGTPRTERPDDTLSD
jgi:nitrogen fixation protein NifU and related proteins